MCVGRSRTADACYKFGSFSKGLRFTIPEGLDVICAADHDELLMHATSPSAPSRGHD